MKTKRSKEYETLNECCFLCTNAMRFIMHKYSAFNAQNNSWVANTIYFTEMEMNKDIETMSEVLENVYLNMYESRGFLTKDLSESGMKMYRARVVYYEILHEVLMLHNSTFEINAEYPYQFGKDKNEEIDGIVDYGPDRYLKEKQALVKKALEKMPYITIDFSLPRF